MLGDTDHPPAAAPLPPIATLAGVPSAQIGTLRGAPSGSETHPARSTTASGSPTPSETPGHGGGRGAAAARKPPPPPEDPFALPDSPVREDGGGRGPPDAAASGRPRSVGGGVRGKDQRRAARKTTKGRLLKQILLGVNLLS